MKRLRQITLATLGAFLTVGCGTTSPERAKQLAATLPATPAVMEPVPEPPPLPLPATAPAPAVEPAAPPGRSAVLVGEWTRRWSSGATGAIYRASLKSEGLSLVTLEEGFSVEEVEFDGEKLTWRERWGESTDGPTERNSAQLQPDGKTFLGSSWVPSLQTGRKFRLEKRE